MESCRLNAMQEIETMPRRVIVPCSIGVLLLVLTIVSKTQAETMAVDFISVSTAVRNGSFNLGWQFNLQEPIKVTSLGYWNPAGDHPVGIYDSTGALLVSTTVSLSDPHVGSWYFHTLDTPYLLATGNDYEVVGVNGSTSYTHSYYVGGMTVADGIQWVGGGVAGLNYDGLLHYGLVNGSNGGYFGPNFKFEPVPEPSTFALLGMGVVGLLGWASATARSVASRPSKWIRPRGS